MESYQDSPLIKARAVVINVLLPYLPKELGALVGDYLYIPYEDDRTTRGQLHGVEPYFVMLRVLTALQEGRFPFDILQDPIGMLTEGIPVKEVAIPKMGPYISLSPEDLQVLKSVGDEEALKLCASYPRRSRLSRRETGDQEVPYYKNDSSILIKLLKEGRLSVREDLELHRIYDTPALSRVVTVYNSYDSYFDIQNIEGLSEELPWS